MFKGKEMLFKSICNILYKLKCFSFVVPGEITLVALGPLTNIALAIRLDPAFGSKLKDVIIMGGSIEGEWCP